MSSLDIAKLDLMYVGIIIFTGLLGGVIAKKIKVPDIVLFLLIGIGLGPTIGGVLHVPADSKCPGCHVLPGLRLWRYRMPPVLRALR